MQCYICSTNNYGNTSLHSKGPLLKCQKPNSRHDDDTEIQPVPWISEEGEALRTKPSGQDLNQRLECVNASECIPAETHQRKHLANRKANRKHLTVVTTVSGLFLNQHASGLFQCEWWIVNMLHAHTQSLSNLFHTCIWCFFIWAGSPWLCIRGIISEYGNSGHLLKSRPGLRHRKPALHSFSLNLTLSRSHVNARNVRDVKKIEREVTSWQCGIADAAGRTVTTGLWRCSSYQCGFRDPSKALN